MSKIGIINLFPRTEKQKFSLLQFYCQFIRCAVATTVNEVRFYPTTSDNIQGRGFYLIFSSKILMVFFNFYVPFICGNVALRLRCIAENAKTARYVVSLKTIEIAPKSTPQLKRRDISIYRQHVCPLFVLIANICSLFIRINYKATNY